METWSERLKCLMEQAKSTNGFTHNLPVSRMYYKLLNAIEAKDAEKAKKLISKMGF